MPVRIQPFEGEPSERVRAVFDATRTSPAADALNIFRTLAHNGRVLQHMASLGGVFLVAGTLPIRLREIVILRVGSNTRCEYEFAQHVRIGMQSGLSEAECLALLEADPGGDFDDDERTAVAMVDELCAADMVSAETWARLDARWSEGEIVELLMLAGYYRMVAGFLNSAGVELEEGLAGWPDGGAAPLPGPAGAGEG